MEAHDVWHDLGLEEMSDCDEDPASSGGSDSSRSESPECDSVMPEGDGNENDCLLGDPSTCSVSNANQPMKHSIARVGEHKATFTT